MTKKVLLIDPISVHTNNSGDIWLFEDVASIRYTEEQVKAISEHLGKHVTDTRHGQTEIKYFSNYGLLMLGYLLKQSNISVSYTNGDYFATEEEYISHIKANYGDFDIYCFTSTTPQSSQVIRLARAVKNMNSSAITILGGPHTKYYLFHERDEEYDYVIMGYGIDKTRDLIKNLLNDEKCTSRIIDSGKYYDCPKDFSLIPEDKKDGTLWYNYFGIGCPHRCKYCVEPHDNICFADIHARMDEVEYAIRTYDLKMFHFADSEFFLRESVYEQVMDEIEERGIKCAFSVNTSPTALIRLADKPIMKRFRKNGLIEILLGTEHFSENVRKNLSKFYNLSELMQALDIVKHKVGIPIVSLYSMVGLPFEYEEDIKINVETFKQMREKDLFDFVFPKFFVPYPGSEIFMNPEKFDVQIVSDDLTLYNRKSLVRPVKINGMDDSVYVEEIKDLIRTNKDFDENEIYDRIKNNNFAFNL